jgi:hypothetical protein
MAKKNTHYGEFAFLAGVVLALLVGLLSVAGSLPDSSKPVVVAVLVVLGIIVGFVNIKDKEIHGFLVAALVLMMTASAWEPINTLLGQLGDVGTSLSLWLGSFFEYLVAFISPAAFIVALKAIYDMARD